jgi:hypothetical protein
LNSKYPATEFGSLDELCSLIHTATKGWDTKWFRGAKSPNHQLLPKLFRDEELAKREGYISVEFRRRARSQLANIDSQFDWLCAMQHYGIPTRLLDWTESLAVALYFTVRPVGLDLIAPTIWLLEPFELFALTNTSKTIIPIAKTPEVWANADIAFDEEGDEAKKYHTVLPVPVAPDFIFSRLAVQNGTFTIHGSDKSPLEDLIPSDRRNILQKFVARNDRVNAIYDCIDLVMPSSDAVFPDIEGLKDYII